MMKKLFFMLLLLSGYVMVLPTQAQTCTLIADVFTRTRISPALSADPVGEFLATDSRLAIAQTRAEDGFIWWQLEDLTWVRGDRVFEQGNCTSLPDGMTTNSPAVMTSTATSEPEASPEVTAQPTTIPDNPILYEDAFDTGSSILPAVTIDFSGSVNGAYIIQKIDNDGLAQVVLSSDENSGTAPVFRQPYQLSLDVLATDADANNLCVVLLFDVIQGYANFRRFQICQNGVWTYINAPDESATYSGTLQTIDLQDVRLTLLVTENVYSLFINETLITHVQGNGTIFGSVGFGIVPQNDAPGTLYAEFDNLLVRRLSREEIATAQTFTVCPPSAARSSAVITIAESCLRGVLDGAWSEQCFCEATDTLLEATRLQSESPLTQLADDATACITCTIVEGQIACGVANDALTLTVNFTPVDDGGGGLLCVVDG